MAKCSEIGKQPVKPSNIYCGDDEAREVTEQLIRDAGYEPVSTGGLENARTQEESLALLIAISRAGGGQPFYRCWRPGEL